MPPTALVADRSRLVGAAMSLVADRSQAVEVRSELAPATTFLAPVTTQLMAAVVPPIPVAALLLAAETLSAMVATGKTTFPTLRQRRLLPLVLKAHRGIPIPSAILVAVDFPQDIPVAASLRAAVLAAEASLLPVEVLVAVDAL